MIVNGVIYIGSSDLKRVLAIDLETGKTKWSFRTSGYSFAAASIDQSNAYIGSIESDRERKASGFLYLLNLETGNLIEKIEVPSGKPGYLNGIYGEIAVGKTMYYAASIGGKIMAFKK